MSADGQTRAWLSQSLGHLGYALHLDAHDKVDRLLADPRASTLHLAEIRLRDELIRRQGVRVDRSADFSELDTIRERDVPESWEDLEG